MLRDISVAMGPATPEWPGDTRFSCLWTWSMREGASVNVSAIHTSPHVGTHADAPLHVRDGWTASHELTLDAFSGRALVVSVRGRSERLSIDDLGGLAGNGRIERLLLRTGRGIAGMHFPDSWPAVAPETARALLARGLVLLGVDTPSVDARESKTLEVHRVLFEGGANVLENLDLRDVPEGEYELIAYPIKVHGLDAAPVRAVLRDLPGRG
ncbi:MAG TPA: cyclase family protein [Gemmatimonadaceae bacterium]|nr:cyclase family protein [Gemmatimonadaceae bacterium]